MGLALANPGASAAIQAKMNEMLIPSSHRHTTRVPQNPLSTEDAQTVFASDISPFISDVSRGDRKVTPKEYRAWQIVALESGDSLPDGSFMADESWVRGGESSTQASHSTAKTILANLGQRIKRATVHSLDFSACFRQANMTFKLGKTMFEG